MSNHKVIAIVGSLRKESYNLKLAKAIAKLGANSFDIQFAVIGDLPLFNQDLEANFPAPALRLKQDIESADAVLFVTPEYNRGFSAAMKNALDWASRPYGKNSFTQKPAALCGTSPGAIGTACAQQALKPILVYLGLILMGQPEVYFQFKENAIDADGNIQDAATEKFLQSFADRFAAWIDKHK